MSIFKLSGNMALGGSGNNYPVPQDISDIKNSLRLLKAKQANKRNFDIPENNYQGYNYNNQYQSPNTDATQRKPKAENYHNNYNYAEIAKNHLPPGYGHSSSTAPENLKYRSKQQDYLGQNYKQGNDMSDKYGSKQISMSNKYAVDSLERQRINSYSHQSKNGDLNYGSYDQGYTKNNGQRVNKYEQIAYEKAQNNVRVRGRGNTYEPEQFISNVKGTGSSQGNYGNIKYSESKQGQYGNGYPTQGIKSNQNRNNSYQQVTRPKRSEPQYNAKRQPQYNNSSLSRPNVNLVTEKPIRQVNRLNQVDIIQYDPKQFVKCRMGCDRKFNPDSIQKHQAICKKVFQAKRKQFDSAQHRIAGEQQAKYVRQAQKQIKKSNNVNQMKSKPQGKAGKLPKWKADSEAFRAVLKQNRGQNFSNQEINKMKAIEAQQQDSMIKCSYCGRTFSEKAGPRHVAFCQQQAKKNGIKKR